MIETQIAGSWPTRFPHLTPRDQEPPPPPPPPPPPRHRHRQAHVLAVDDSLVDRKVIETLLRISSCKVTVVDSASRALQFLGLLDRDRSSAADHDDGSEIDMIITDYCMPGMTGYELLKKIKESSAFREVPVVIMSSENINARIDRCLEGGAEDYIVKPVKLSDVRRIKDYLMRDNRSNKRMMMDRCGPSTSTTASSSAPSSMPSSSSTDSPVSSPDVADQEQSEPGSSLSASSDLSRSVRPSSSLSLSPAQSSVHKYSPSTSSQSSPPHDERVFRH